MIVRVQAACPQHMAFITDTWMKSYRRAPEVRDVPKDIYSAGMRARVERLLKASEVYVASAGGVYVGWSCFDGERTHYCYVKSLYRRQGIATSLLQGAPKLATHYVPGAWNKALKASGWSFVDLGST